MKKIIVILFSILIFFVFTGCDIQSGSGGEQVDSEVIQSDGKGNILIYFTLSDVGEKRIIEPDVDMNPAYYIITLSGPDGQSISQKINKEQFEAQDLICGTWAILLEAYNLAGEKIGEGGATVYVEDDKKNIANILIYPINGTGTLIVNIIWHNIGNINYKYINMELKHYGDVTRGIKLYPDEQGTTSKTISDLKSGYYLLVLKLYADNELKAGSLEVIRILNNKNTIGEFEFFPGVDNSVINVNIDSTPLKTIELEIRGIIEGETITGLKEAQAVILNEEANNVEFVWYLNGNAVGTGITYTIEPNPDQLLDNNELGLAVFTVNGDRGGSCKVNFSVIIDKPYIAWQKMYGGSFSDEASTIKQTVDNGYIVVGYSDSIDVPGVLNNGKRDIYVIKLNKIGEIEWQKMYGGGDDEWGWWIIGGECVQQTYDEGFIIVGSSRSDDIEDCTNNGLFDYYIIKTDKYGEIEWQRMYGFNEDDKTYAVKQTTDGGYVIAGTCDIAGVDNPENNYGSLVYYIIKLDANGDIEWDRMYGGKSIDEPWAIQQTVYGRYIVAGSSNSDIPGLTNNGSSDCYIIKLDLSGNVLWQKMYGGNGYDYAYSIQQTYDFGYIVAGTTNSTYIPGLEYNSFYESVYIMKLDSYGEIDWQKLIGGNSFDTACSIQEVTIGNAGYIVAGASSSTDIPDTINHGRRDIYIIKLSEDGDIDWQRMYGGNNLDEAYSVIQASDGGYVAAGSSCSTDIYGVTNKGRSDFYIMKIVE